jgi:hypothetical protein
MLRVDRHDWGSGSAVRVEVTDPAHHTVINHNRTGDTAAMHAHARATGERLVALTGHQLPAAGSPFEIEITYTAPQTV